MATLLRGLADLVFAPVCLGCDGPILPGDGFRLVCRRCRSRLRPLPSPACPRCGAPQLRTGRAAGPVCGECRHWPEGLHTARSACLLQPPANRLVHHLKYNGWRALARPLAERMASVRLPEAATAAETVVPVPTTPDRLRRRGYNQAALLAGALARRTHRVVGDWLERTGASASQTTLHRAARGANVAGAFRVVPGAEHRVRGARLLLVDDVLTTGATAAECARVLDAAGARRVDVLTFARTVDTRWFT